jgi:hypothetical protein
VEVVTVRTMRASSAAEKKGRTPGAAITEFLRHEIVVEMNPPQVRFVIATRAAFVFDLK